MLLYLPETSKQIQQRQQIKNKSIGVWQLRSWRCPCFLWHLLPQVQIRIGLRGVRIPPLSKIGAPDWRCSHDRHTCSGARPSPVGSADQGCSDDLQQRQSPESRPFSTWLFARTAKSPVAPPPSGTDMVTNYLHQRNGGKMGAGRHRPFPFYGQVRSPQSWFSITTTSQTPRKSKDAPLSKATPPTTLTCQFRKKATLGRPW